MINSARKDGKIKIMSDRIDVYRSVDKEVFKPPCVLLSSDSGACLAIEYEDLETLRNLADEAEEAFVEHFKNSS